ncbi:hypothetical protein K0T92_09540 [Paenibacillus oenotherae]|uniref:Flagellar protein FliT n=1 Tax=Paenibacillus oenotherae TaxID=1435645 RepID=A0ABS7D5Z8_9BACL|nr:hypothetical protein [Paenibacillus oenotherae]MBW7474987.1 hypothetical protein [Paenibacillus oenotherae]
MDKHSMLTKLLQILEEMKSISEQQYTLIADDMEEEALHQFAALALHWEKLSLEMDSIVAEAELEQQTWRSNPEIRTLLEEMNDKTVLMNSKLEGIAAKTIQGIEGARKQQTAVRSYGGMNSMDVVSLYFDQKQ